MNCTNCQRNNNCDCQNQSQNTLSKDEMLHEIDNDTLAAIFYAMPTHKKRKLSNKLRDRIEIEDLDENIKVGLRRIRQILIESIRYDTEAALVHRKPKTTSVEETGRMI